VLKDQILNLLHAFQAGYDKKDKNDADLFMKKLFVESDDISILGTSLGELCLGYEKCKKLFTDDWEYWSFERLELNALEIKEFGDIVLVYVPAYFSFTFKSDQNYEGYIDDLKEQLTKSENLEQTFGDINWIISHFLHQRACRDRKYLNDLKVCFICIKTNDGYKIKQIQFSVPEDYSDPRLVDPWINGAYEKEKEILQSKKTTDSSVQDSFKNFSSNLIQQDLDLFIEQYFQEEDLLVVNVDDYIARDIKQLKDLLIAQRKNWQNLEINFSAAYIEKEAEYAYFITNGVAKNIISKETYLNNSKEKVLEICNLEISDNEKLFFVRKEIATAFRDTTVSDKYDWPLRVHVLMKKTENRWLIHYLQFSYPFYYILENKNRFMKLVNDDTDKF